MIAEQPKLGRRWTPLAHHDEQRRMWRSSARFKVGACGRRSGKTELAKRHTVLVASEASKLSYRRYALTAPVHLQAKRIFWNDLKALVPRELQVHKSESELMIRLYNGTEVFVCGLDVPARIEGPPLDGIVLDEYGNMRPETWAMHVRPMLAERNGWAWFIGVPEGRNHYYDLWLDAGEGESWDRFHWTMEEVLPLYLGEEQAARELDEMRRDMDELTYQQEALASWVSFEGRAYYGFGPENVKELSYESEDDLVLCFDFNVAPGVAAVCQERDGATLVIGEVYVPRNSNTPIVCRKLLTDWGKHQGRVLCYGDATGGARGSAKVRGSDWELIREILRPAFRDRLRFRVPKGNPRERVRVNAMNSRIKNAKGERRLFVDPKCKHVIRDFEGVTLVEGGSGEIDKHAAPNLTHISDAIGYYVAKRHPALSGHVSEVQAI